ncbi:rhodanese-like domain-containing protein [Thalassospiraceae bacterium LMO-JJ14]|nr:rhodanese-like domain-containing protein [Thalassospiraceae bacterium LMO-JJ14]
MQSVSPPELKTLIDHQQVILFDIRGEDEFAAEHIPGAVLLPSDQIDNNLPLIVGDKDAVFYCSSGIRTENATPLINKSGIGKTSILTGGINAWRDNGLPVVAGHVGSAGMSIARQVQLIVGVMILALSAWTLVGPPQVAYATMAIGAGLAFAGLTGTCALARIVLMMPWNRTAG